jgi:Flp pilus assembly CpaF family ATPase
LVKLVAGKTKTGDTGILFSLLTFVFKTAAAIFCEKNDILPKIAEDFVLYLLLTFYANARLTHRR